MDVKLTTTLYKRIVGERAQLEDLEEVDPVHHKSLLWMLKNNITDVIFESFSVEHEAFGVEVSSELVPGGADIDVTQENKEEYVEAYLEFRFHQSCAEQVQVCYSRIVLAFIHQHVTDQTNLWPGPAERIL